MTEPLTMKAIGEAITSFWGRSALLLWCLSVCAVAAFAVLLVGAHFQINGAAELVQSCGVWLALAAMLLPIVAGFQTYSEWPKPSLVLLPIADQCVWAQGPPRDGKAITQFGIRFQAANMSNGAIMLSEIVLRRPWVRRRSIIVRDLNLKGPNSHYYGHEHPVPAQSLSYGSATIIVDHPIGRKGKPIRLVVGVRDHEGRWHKLVVPFVRHIG